MTRYFHAQNKRRHQHIVSVKQRLRGGTSSRSLLLGRNVLTNTGRPKRQPPLLLHFSVDKSLQGAWTPFVVPPTPGPPTRLFVFLMPALDFHKSQSLIADLPLIHVQEHRVQRSVFCVHHYITIRSSTLRFQSGRLAFFLFILPLWGLLWV